MWKLTAPQKATAVERYADGESTFQIGRSMGVSDVAIRRLLQRRGVAMRSNSESHTRLPLNHEAFDVLTPEAAYWCGFIAADGTIVRRSGAPEVAVVLAVKDRSHLEKFRDFLGSTHAITPISPGRQAKSFPGSTGASRFSFRSQRIADRLTELGVKRGPLAPELASSRDFWRGVVDGDGWITADPAIPRLEVVGYPYLLDPLAAFLAGHDVTGPTVRTHKTISRAQYSGISAIRTAGLLWTGCSVSLDRKRDAALAVAAALPGVKGGRGEARGSARLTTRDVVEIRRLYEGGEISHHQLGVMFGVSRQSIGKLLAGRTWASV